MSTPSDHELGKELHATLRARKELGPEYESELIESFLEKAAARLDSQVQSRVRRELAQQQTSTARVATRSGPRGFGDGDGGRDRRFGLAAVSLVLAVPLSAIGATNDHLAGLLVTWAGIVAVNVAHALGTALPARLARDRDRGESGGQSSDWD
ncbi:hypothetical protein POF50_027100 [Streptomyces sp. SL13]|uniref:Integral membrane protein n=1 Tax=Streptantibioticus silvisoli TaxID=2705255 RepID=A0AA90H8G2_9ACTN|nr:hypothetical protein [Streptantibioticus silvisoli]MDI5965247.1 hypothetical protein [Streptantibioticus silvisoli]MDI5972970.1 hypothetical protein [Streptantibioticus silvisoli]